MIVTMTEYYQQLFFPGIKPVMQLQLEHQPYTVDQLPEETAAPLLDKHRDINTYYDDWHDYVLEDFKKAREEEGWDDLSTQYTGFCSQGDGAMFTGNIYSENLFKLMEKNDMLPAQIKLMKMYNKAAYEYLSDQCALTINHRGHYYHSGGMSINFEMPLADEDLNYELSIGDWNDIESKLSTYCTDLADDLYTKLHSAYETQRSDAAVAEGMTANGHLYNYQGEEWECIQE